MANNGYPNHLATWRRTDILVDWDKHVYISNSRMKSDEIRTRILDDYTIVYLNMHTQLKDTR